MRFIMLIFCMFYSLSLYASIDMEIIASTDIIESPGENVEFLITLENRYLEDKDIYFYQLNDSINGDLTSLCGLPVYISSLESYDCRYNVLISGYAGDEVVNSFLVHADSDIAQFSKEILKTITIINGIQPRPILQTRQYNCYDSSGAAIICKGSGQDGDYNAGLIHDMHYDVISGVVSNHTTELQWQDNYSDNKGYALDNNIPSLYWLEAQAYCDAIDVGNFTDWRLPARDELATLVEYNSSASAIDTSLFINYVNNFYWTATDYVPSANLSDAWIFNMGYGTVSHAAKSTESNYIRCVRGKEFSTNFEKSVDIVNDDTMQLQWQDNAVVLTNQHTWDQAINYCEHLTLDDHENWRLPNVSELFSIVDDKNQLPAIFSDFINEQSSRAYWSATTYMADKKFAWVLYNADGQLSPVNKSVINYYTRCVRNDTTILPITQTMQTRCYSMSGAEINCMNTGQDGDYQKGLLRQYSRDDAIGVVNDLATGLMWQDDYTDAGIGMFSKSGTWEEAKNYCEASTLGDYSSWRLPTKYELIMLLDRTGIEYAIDPEFQSKVFLQNLWTQNVYAQDMTRAWTVYFNNSGFDMNSSKSADNYVRCVIGEVPMHGEWVREKDVVTDKRTNLQWQDNFDAKSAARLWDSALQYCNGLILDGKNDWRLPNINELHTLVDITQVMPALSPVFEYVIAENYGDYWSSSSNEPINHDKAHGIDFSNGDDFMSLKSSSYYTRCVRGPEKAVTFNPAVIMYLLN